MEADLHQVIGAVYGCALSASFAEFKRAALRAIKPLIPFDSAVWGAGVHSTNTMLALTLLDQPDEMLLDYAARWQDQDRSRKAAVAAPGRAFSSATLQPVEEYTRAPIYTQFCSRWGIEDALVIVQPSGSGDHADIFCLFRSDRSALFGAQDARSMEQIAPHLSEAWNHAQKLQHERNGVAENVGGLAIAGRDGLLRAAGQTFVDQVRRVDPDWAGPFPAAIPARTDIRRCPGARQWMCVSRPHRTGYAAPLRPEPPIGTAAHAGRVVRGQAVRDRAYEEAGRRSGRHQPVDGAQPALFGLHEA